MSKLEREKKIANCRDRNTNLTHNMSSILFPKEWHRKCFKCKDCNKTLDSIIACDGPDKDVYCKTCYGKKWGPHGYGFACGSGFLQTDGLSLVTYIVFG